MGFLSSLFGNSKKKALQDDELGSFTALSHTRDRTIWQGQVKFLNTIVSLFISGNSDQLNASQKAALFDLLKNEIAIEQEIDEALRTEFEEADKEYSKWQNHFNFISISTLNNEISTTFEEKGSLYHFNVFLLNGKQAGVSIDR
jgi:hypothetical protein